MKKYTLAMSVSLLMSSVAFAGGPFDINMERDDSGVLKAMPSFSSSTVLGKFEESFRAQLTQSRVWSNDTPLRTLYARVLSANPLEGSEVMGILMAEPKEWDSKIKLTYKEDKGKLNTVQRQIAAGKKQIQSTQSQWNSFVADMKKRNPLCVTVDKDSVRFDPVKGLIFASLSSFGPYALDWYARRDIYKALTTGENPFMTVHEDTPIDTKSYTFATSLPKDTTGIVLGGEFALPGATALKLFGNDMSVGGGVRRIPAVIGDSSDVGTMTVNVTPSANSDLVLGNSDTLTTPTVVVPYYRNLLQSIEEGSLSHITDATMLELYNDEATLKAISRALKLGGTLEFRLVGGKAAMGDLLLKANMAYAGKTTNSVTFKKVDPKDFPLLQVFRGDIVKLSDAKGIDRSQLSEALTADHLDKMWELNAHYMNYGSEHGSFEKDSKDKTKELAYARRLIKVNSAVCWYPSLASDEVFGGNIVRLSEAKGIDRSQLSEALTTDHLDKMWELNAHFMNYGSEHGSFEKDSKDKTRELAYARRLIKVNSLVSWYSEVL